MLHTYIFVSAAGFEPATSRFRAEYSTAEPRADNVAVTILLQMQAARLAIRLRDVRLQRHAMARALALARRQPTFIARQCSGIRTRDPFLPREVRYQAALRTDVRGSHRVNVPSSEHHTPAPSACPRTDRRELALSSALVAGLPSARTLPRITPTLR